MSIARLTTIALLLAAPLAAASAQGYTRSASDTLRYRESTKGEMTLSGMQGDVSMTTEQSATVGVLVLPGDSARAWYEAMDVSASGPMGQVAPDVKSILGKPFRLAFDERGRVTTREAPQLPAELSGITDLSHQFDDFFLRLPGQPLRVGLAWTDTVVRTDSTAEKRLRTETIGTFRVERDTVVAGEKAFVVSGRQALRAESEGDVPAQGVHAKAVLTGTDEGLLVFAAQSGRYLGRQRTGGLSGDVTMEGNGFSATMKQTFKFTNRVEAVR